MPAPRKRLMTSPLTLLPAGLLKARPATTGTFAPLSSMIGVPAKPGCVVPSMTTGWLIDGSPVSGAIVRTPVPGMLNEMRSTSPVSAFESRMACRSDPGPLSFVFVTRIVRPIAVTVVVTVRLLFAGFGSA